MDNVDELKISEMIEAESVNEEDLIMIVQNGVNKKVPASKVGTGVSGGDTLPVGAVVEWYSDIIPENWLLCDGREVNRNDYSSLFKLLGIKHGLGNGSTTFNLPDLRRKVAVGKDENDNDFNELGKTGGEKKHQLTIDELLEHNHEVTRHHFWHGEQSDLTDVLGDSTVVKGKGIIESTSKTGESQPFNILQPYITCNFIIKAKQSSGLVATVIDNLESESETDALSARQGKLLKEVMEQKVLYENSEGSNKQIILSKTSGNFDYLYITFMVNVNQEKQEKTIRVDKPNGKVFYESMQYSSGNDHLEVFSKFYINENIITPVVANCGYRTQSYLNSSVSMHLDTTNYLRITKVLAGKY